jgi:hypothetical protein
VFELELEEAGNIAAEFVLNRLRASSVEVLETRPDGKPDVVAVLGLLEDGAGRSREFEVKVNELTKAVVAWNILF